MLQLGAFLLPVVPLLVLLACLLFGRYPGCEAIIRLATRLGRRRTRRPVSAPTPIRPRSYAPAGGLLLAVSLSGRAPPARS